jgi:GNAT superfamily N-acetyltransferase
VIPLTPDLLAPGDQKSVALAPSSFVWTRIRSTDDPAFERAYSALWAEFGAANEMEARSVLAGRFANPEVYYEILLVEKDGAFCAVRDHTAVWSDGEVFVHLSHVLVAPEQRRTGLAGWLRAAPIVAARELASAHGQPGASVTLVGEMEYDDGSDPKRAVRLAAYERAGYLKIDPAVVRFAQPDFRPVAVIDAEGVSRPLPFQLVVRRVGRELERAMRGASVRCAVRALYKIYGAQFRKSEMEHPMLSLENYPSDETLVALIPPTTPVT